MGAWSKQKVDASTINGGNEYEKGDRVSRQALNSIVNNSLFAADTVEGLGEGGEYSGSASYIYPNIVTYNGSGYMAIYKQGGSYVSFSGIIPTNTTYWKLIAQKGADGGGGAGLPSGGTDGDVLVKSGSTDYAAQWASNVVHFDPTGTSTTEQTLLDNYYTKSDMDNVPTQNSNRPVKSGGVYSSLNTLINSRKLSMYSLYDGSATTGTDLSLDYDADTFDLIEVVFFVESYFSFAGVYPAGALPTAAQQRFVQSTTADYAAFYFPSSDNTRTKVRIDEKSNNVSWLFMRGIKFKGNI